MGVDDLFYCRNISNGWFGKGCIFGERRTFRFSTGLPWSLLFMKLLVFDRIEGWQPWSYGLLRRSQEWAARFSSVRSLCWLFYFSQNFSLFSRLTDQLESCDEQFATSKINLLPFHVFLLLGFTISCWGSPSRRKFGIWCGGAWFRRYHAQVWSYKERMVGWDWKIWYVFLLIPPPRFFLIIYSVVLQHLSNMNTQGMLTMQ